MFISPFPLPAVLLSCLLTLCVACSGQQQTYSTKKVSTEKPAIPIGTIASKLDSNIFVIFQDSKDHYWFGSNGQGLFHYDGTSIRQITSDDGLYDNRVREIQEDQFGNIYINTQGGISRFDGQMLKKMPMPDSASPSTNWKLEAEDLWFKGDSRENGPYRLDLSADGAQSTIYHLEFQKHYLEEAFLAEYPNSSYSPYGIYEIYQDSKGNIWLGTSNFGVCRFDGQTLSWLYEPHLTQIGAASFGIRSIIEDRAGDFWFCNTHYRYVILPEDSISNGFHFIRYRKENGVSKSNGGQKEKYPYFMSVTADNNGDLWMSTYENGVWQYKAATLFHHPITKNGSIVNLISIYKDNHGVLWLGSQGSGVYRFNGWAFEPFLP